jgi:hypothetical protein
MCKKHKEHEPETEPVPVCQEVEPECATSTAEPEIITATQTTDTVTLLSQPAQIKQPETIIEPNNIQTELMIMPHNVQSSPTETAPWENYKPETSITLKEYYNNIGDIEELVNVTIEDPNYIRSFSGTEHMNAQDITKLKTLCSKQNMVFKMKYTKKEFGRYWSHGHSLQNIRSKFRRILLQGEYNDLDIVNALPNILINVCSFYKIDCTALQMYVDNREKILSKMIDGFSCTRDQAKELMIRTLMGGSVKKAIQEYNLQFNKHIRNTTIPFLEGLSNEIKCVNKELSQTEMYKKCLSFVESLKKNKRKLYIESSVLSLYCQEIECRIMSKAIEYLNSKDVNVLSLIHDGCIVPSLDNADNVCIELQNYIYQELGLVIQFKSKSTEMTEEDKVWLEKNKQFIDEDADDVLEYEACKEYHEIENGLCMIKADCFYMYKVDGVYNSYSVEQLRRLITGDYMYYTEDGQEKEFILTWLKDPNRKTYSNVDFMPTSYYDKCRDNTLNLWENYGWVWENCEYTPEEKEQALELYNHIRMMCEKNDGNMKYMCHYLNHLLTYPGDLPRVAILLRGEQGTGKGTFCSILEKLVETTNYEQDLLYSTDNILRDCFEKHSTAWAGRLILWNDEASRDNVKGVSGAVKNFITETKKSLEPKNKAQRPQRNCCRLIASQNTRNSYSIEPGDRRFIAFQVPNDVKNDAVYANRIKKNIRNPNVIKALAGMIIETSGLSGAELGEYDFTNKRPITEAYEDMQQVYVPNEARFLDQYILHTSRRKQQEVKMTIQEFVTGYNATFSQYPVTNERVMKNLKNAEVPFEPWRGSKSRGIKINVPDFHKWMRSMDFTDVYTQDEIGEALFNESDSDSD